MMFVPLLAISLLTLRGVITTSEKYTGEYGHIIGIDLGTTYSCVAISRNGIPEVISNDQGNRISPSYISFTDDGTILIGDAAKLQSTSNPTNTIYGVKRIIGRKWNDELLQQDISNFPFKVIEKDSRPYVEVKLKDSTKVFAPEELSAMVLHKMKQVAEAYLGTNVTNAVVTVPAYFNDAQREATKNAGRIAGLNVLRIINEPTAAAIAYGLNKRHEKKQAGETEDTSEGFVLVFDLGGGTFDVSLLTIDDGVFEVVATNGNTHLGGEDFDQRVLDHFIKVFQKKTSKDISSDPRAQQKLKREVEKAKRTLSYEYSVTLEVPAIMDKIEFKETLTRAKFEDLNSDLFLATLEPVRKVLEDADIDASQVVEVVLVGGSTRIPKIRALLSEFFDSKRLNNNINPDEAVAFGAAVQGSVLAGDNWTSELLLLDVCPLTLGIEIEGGVMAKLIERNTPIPAVKRDIFTTVQHNQPSVTTSVYEGERPLVKDNHLLGEFELTGIPRAPRGVPQIEVMFEIDVNGILKVSAEDKASGAKNHITIRGETRLKPDEINRMVKEAEALRKQDSLVQERINAMTDLEGYLHSTFAQTVSNQKFRENHKPTAVDQLKQNLTDTINWFDFHRKNNTLTTEMVKSKQSEVRHMVEEIISRSEMTATMAKSTESSNATTPSENVAKHEEL